jgi:hypothetical protein
MNDGGIGLVKWKRALPPEIAFLTLRFVLAAPPRTWIPGTNKRPLFPIQELFG